jgi:D-glycero-alpha-D-manno-heptose-7-phosphate kinase
VSFAGGGTDLSDFYERDYGAVLRTAIDKYIYVTVKRHGEVFDEKVRLSYSKTESVATVDEVENNIAHECLRFLQIEPPSTSVPSATCQPLPDLAVRAALL